MFNVFTMQLSSFMTPILILDSLMARSRKMSGVPLLAIHLHDEFQFKSKILPRILNPSLKRGVVADWDYIF